MKKFYLVGALIIFANGLNAQIINIPDINFKNRLLASHPDTYLNYYITAADSSGQDMTVDTNGNGEIEVSEAQAVYFLNVQGVPDSNYPTDLVSLSGIEYFTNLIELNCADNVLTSLDVSALTHLQNFRCDRNNLSSLNISGLTTIRNFWYGTNHLPNVDFSACVNLVELGCDNNQVTNLDVSMLPYLYWLVCSNNQISNLDFSHNNSMRTLFCDNNLITNLDISPFRNYNGLHCNNNPLVTLNLKFGKALVYNDLTGTNMNISGCPSLQYVCADDSNTAALQTKINGYGYNCTVNSYCSFTPGGTFYTLSGNSKFDNDNTGCGNGLFFPHINMKVTKGSVTANFIGDNSGHYFIPLQYGTYTVTPILENPSFYNISPPSYTVTLPTANNSFVQDFCMTRNGEHVDLEIELLPMSIARPGFDAAYRIIYKNIGTSTQSGTVSFSYNDAMMDFVSTDFLLNTTSVGLLTWNYQNLAPFEQREINIVLNLNSPMETLPITAGTDLGFGSMITPIDIDEDYQNNHSSIKQVAVNSHDPNDKTCLEGATITPEMVGKEIHYMIRFENTGTANAENIVVKDIIDTSRFDINSLVPIGASAPFVTRISDTNKVEFIFENINLPFDDAHNDGYVAFKIKTKPTLVLGNLFNNTASIYFDYNFPIVTNTATTTVALLAAADFDFDSYFSIAPNPAENFLNIHYKKEISVSSVSIYNVLGQLVLAVPNAQEISKIDVSGLKAGSYFLKINSDSGTSGIKFIKN